MIRIFKGIGERKLAQWAVAYIAGAWLLLQVLDVLAETFTWSPVVERVATVLLVMGLPAALVLAWYHGERGRQRASAVELLMLGGILVAAGAAVTTVTGGRGGPVDTAAVSAEDVVDTGLPDDASIAVLAFDNMSGNPEMAWFSEGVSEEILNAVAQIPGLFVQGRTSSFALTDQGLLVTEIGSRLGVANVLDGSVRQDGNRVRITAQLIDARTGGQRWSASYDFVEADLFTIQDAIAEEVAARLELDLAPEAALASRGQTNVPEAHQYYLRGLSGIRRGDQIALEAALQHFDSAIGLDPEYALAFAGKALAYGYLADSYWVPAEAYPLSLAAVEEALRIAPDLGEALGYRGTVQAIFNWDMDAASADLARALAVNPNYWFTHFGYYVYWTALGDLTSACQAAEEGTRVDPLQTLMWDFWILCSVATGDFDGAIDHYRRLMEIKPDYYYIDEYVGDALTALRRYDEAEGAFDRFERLAGHSPYSRVNYLAARGRVPEAEQLIRELEQLDVAAPELLASGWEAIGDRSKALEWLEVGLQGRSGFAVLVRGVRGLQDVVQSPEYKQLAAEYGFPVPN